MEQRFQRVADGIGRVPDVVKKAARTATQQALIQGREAVYARMRAVFDRPTPYALGSLLVELEASGKAAGIVAVRGKGDVGPSGVPAQSYLRAQIEGGTRRWKRSERALQKTGLLPRGWYAIPGSAARMDAFGNMSRGHVLEILDYLRAVRVDNKVRRSSITDEGRAKRKRGIGKRFGFEYFVVLPGTRGGLQPGVWVRQIATRKAAGPAAPVRQVLTYVKATNYRARLDFFSELQSATSKALPVLLDHAVRAGKRSLPLSAGGAR